MLNVFTVRTLDVYIFIFSMTNNLLTINEPFVKWKILYLLIGAGQGAYVYFLVNFYISRGISYEAAGFIESIVPFLGCIFRPLACYLADRFALHRSLLASSAFIYSLSLMGFIVLSTRLDLIVPHSSISYSNESAVAYQNTSASFNNSQVSDVSSSDNGPVVDWLLPVLCGLRFLNTLGLTPATSLLDGIVYKALETNDQSKNWGRQRLWGSIGFSSAILLSSFLLDMFELVNYVIGFSIAAGSMLIFFVVTLITVRSYKSENWEPKKKEVGEADEKLVKKRKLPESTENHLVYVIKFIFGDGHILLVLAIATAVGFLTACRDIFASQYLESITQRNNKLIMGSAQAILGALEVPVMFMASVLYDRFGTMPFFAICFAAFSVRFGFYTLLTPATVWFFLLIELLHLFCFGLVVPAFTLQAHRRIAKHQNALPEMFTIIQGLVSALYLGLGFGIGSIAGGVLTQNFGGPACMLIFSLIAAGCFICFCSVWLVMTIVSSVNNKRPASQTVDDSPLSQQL